jgi:hypothetical protein
MSEPPSMISPGQEVLTLFPIDSVPLSMPIPQEQDVEDPPVLGPSVPSAGEV